jgi:hypothetical protein
VAQLSLYTALPNGTNLIDAPGQLCVDVIQKNFWYS